MGELSVCLCVSGVDHYHTKPCPFCGGNPELLVNGAGGIVIMCVKCRASVLFGPSHPESIPGSWAKQLFDFDCSGEWVVMRVRRSDGTVHVVHECEVEKNALRALALWKARYNE